MRPVAEPGAAGPGEPAARGPEYTSDPPGGAGAAGRGAVQDAAGPDEEGAGDAPSAPAREARRPAPKDGRQTPEHKAMCDPPPQQLRGGDQPALERPEAAQRSAPSGSARPNTPEQGAARGSAPTGGARPGTPEAEALRDGLLQRLEEDAEAGRMALAAAAAAQGGAEAAAAELRFAAAGLRTSVAGDAAAHAAALAPQLASLREEVAALEAEARARRRSPSARAARRRPAPRRMAKRRTGAVAPRDAGSALRGRR